MHTEAELVEGCLNGNRTTQRLLFERFAGQMMSVCRRYTRDRMEAEDMLQDGFVKVFTKLDQYHFQGSFEGWVRKIMVNTALRTYQRQRFDMEHTGFESLPEHPVDPDALSKLAEEELLAIIAKLPDGYRVIFNLVAIEGYSHAEVAQALGIQESTSRSQLTKARRWLVEQMETLKITL